MDCSERAVMTAESGKSRWQRYDNVNSETLVEYDLLHIVSSLVPGDVSMVFSKSINNSWVLLEHDCLGKGHSVAGSIEFLGSVDPVDRQIRDTDIRVGYELLVNHVVVDDEGELVATALLPGIIQSIHLL